jgi:hypothetical protein
MKKGGGSTRRLSFRGPGRKRYSQVVGAKTSLTVALGKHRRFNGNFRYSGLSASWNRKPQATSLSGWGLKIAVSGCHTEMLNNA